MKIAVSLSLVLAAVASDFMSRTDSSPAFHLGLSKYINAGDFGWKAAEEPYPLFANRTLGQAKKLMGTRLRKPGESRLPRKTYPAAVGLPESFDARKAWPKCPTIGEIRDQSSCGSCWAFGAAEAISDRICTYLGGADPSKRAVRIAAADLMSCCSECGNGCDGGYPDSAWEYWVEQGLVNNTCMPYPFPPCAHHTHTPKYPDCSGDYTAPACSATCADGSQVSDAPTYKGDNSWSLSGEDDFMQELSTNGPFEVTLSVYADFEQYKSGVYRHVTGEFLGGHAVRLVGWGVERGVKYWLIANSWNDSWGEGGYFRIVRGTDECGIEDAGSAGKPEGASATAMKL